MKPTTNADLVSRLMHRVTITETGCWEFQGQRDPKGYGRMAAGRGEKMLAHRLAWWLRHGDPGDLCVLHRCDNPPCVNPADLFLGTRADNNADMHAKGRHNIEARCVGEDHPRAKVTEADVVEIRSLYATGMKQRDIAVRFGLVQAQVWRIIHRQSWARVA